MNFSKLISLSKTSIIDLIEIKKKYYNNLNKTNIIGEVASESINIKTKELKVHPIIIGNELNKPDALVSEKKDSNLNNGSELYQEESANEDSETRKKDSSKRVSKTFGLWNQIQHNIKSITSDK